MFTQNWKKFGIVMILLLLVGAVVACGADGNDNDTTANTNDTMTETGDDVLPTEIPNEPTITPIAEETDDMMEPTAEMEPTMEMEPTAEMAATVESSESEDEAMMEHPTIVQGSDLIGAELMSMSDEKIAEVQEILFDANGDIQYVVLSVEGMTEEFPYYAVAWDTMAVSLNADQEQVAPSALMYDGEAIDLDGALGFDDAMLDSEDLFYQTAEDAGTDTQMLDGLYKLSAFANFSLFDYNLVNANTDDDLGEIEELLVNVDDNRVSYAVADVGGFLGVAETAVAIPWERISFDEVEENFTINANEEELTNAPSIDMSNFDEWKIDNEWEQTLDSYWNDLAS